LNLAKNMGCKTIGLSGRGGGMMNEFCDINLVVPSEDTPRIQEIHIVIGHIIAQACDDLNME
jgi:D-sedoheptulose 7-phosphate isomerase